MSNTVTLMVTNSSKWLDESIKINNTIERNLKLMIKEPIQAQTIKELKLLLEQLPQLNKLSLEVNAAVLAHPDFLTVLVSLKQNKVSQVELIFNPKELADSAISQQITQTLTKTIAPLIDYPLQIGKACAKGLEASDLPLESFQNIIINNIQQRYQLPASATTSHTSTAPNIIHDDKKIKLKERINKKILLKESVETVIPIEVQHVEMTEQHTVQQQQEVTQTSYIAEVQPYEGQLINFEDFHTPLYINKVTERTGDEKLTEALYAVLKNELFANLPHAIKYTSPDAANQLAEYLPNLVTLNKENLPQGFFLKKTAEGEYVLDYDDYADTRVLNEFTPSTQELSPLPWYQIQLNPKELTAWIDDAALLALIIPQGQPYQTPKSLMNLWIKYGDEGVKSFFTEFKKHTRASQGLASFLMAHYMQHIPQWEHLHHPSFFKCLEQISHYDEAKLKCFKNFLEKTGSSLHDLRHTTTAFERFWQELSLRCQEHNVPIEEINQTQWSTPKGGNPVVYMERLLCILNNARDISDQFSGLDELQLTNYGAYYASHYEGYKSVSKEMYLLYSPSKENKKSFNPLYKLYPANFQDYIKEHANSLNFKHILDVIGNRKKREKNPKATAEYDLKREEHRFQDDWYFLNKDYIPEAIGSEEEKICNYWLVNCATELPKDSTINDLKKLNLVTEYNGGNFKPPYKIYSSLPDGSIKLLLEEQPNEYSYEAHYVYGYRYLGQQDKGMKVSEMRSQIKQLEGFYDNKAEIFSIPFLTSIFFVAHQRYEPNVAIHRLIEEVRHTKSSEAFASTIYLLNRLYSLDIKLNQKEGLVLFSSIAGMNSAEYESFGLDKITCVNKLLTILEKNKFAGFKLLNYCCHNPKWPLIFALDTAEFLAQDSLIDSAYDDDLLLFSALINSQEEEAYYHAGFKTTESRETSKGKLILDNIKRVKEYLHQAASQEQPNNLQYAIQALLNAKKGFSYKNFLNACDEICALSAFDIEQVNKILEHHQLQVAPSAPKLNFKNSEDLKSLCIRLILKLDEYEQSPPKDKEQRALELVSLSNEQLMAELENSWAKAGPLLGIIEKRFLNKMLKTYIEIAIQKAFDLQESKESATEEALFQLTIEQKEKIHDRKKLLHTVGKKIHQLMDFQKEYHFEQAHYIEASANKIAELIRAISYHYYVIKNQNDWVTLFDKLDFAAIDYQSLYSILNTLNSMPQRDFLPLLTLCFNDKEFMSNKQKLSSWTNNITFMSNKQLPTEYLQQFTSIMLKNPQQKQFDTLVDAVVKMHEKDNNDPILAFIMREPQLSYKQIEQITELSKQLKLNRDKIKNLFEHLIKTNTLESTLNQIHSCPKEHQKKLIEVMSQGFALAHKKQAIPYDELSALLIGLPTSELNRLHHFYQTTPVSAECLFNALKQGDSTQDLHQLIQQFEKAPFGARDISEQFSTAQVKRVVNYSKDLLNNSSYTYHYRKQWMGAFLFVNQIGHSLPVYYNKPAKDLTNEEIKSFFADLKEKNISGLNSFQCRLLALGLMREAMYRSTGEFPYSTQILALIDGMMHQGDFISNIDTGQGKSLVDLMKATLLWLDSDRVDLITSSLVDAKRDIGNYGSFLNLLGVPYSKQPISSMSSFESFNQQGINFSTIAQLSLFYSKAKAMGRSLDTPNTIMSLVINESDYALLDDRVVYRFASGNGAHLTYGQEWIYEAINDFVTRPVFLENTKASAKEEIEALKAYLKIKAQSLNKSTKLINKFNDEVYLTWIDSALTANYLLEENKNYVIPEGFEQRIINGQEVNTRVVKVLMKDGKVSPDSTFGNGIQQFLYARLNKQTKTNDFVIEPEHKTILSTNNKNLIDHYREHKGFIWGSSGTVGSTEELQEQYHKYGFTFSKIEPHQLNKVDYNLPIIKANEASQFTQLITSLNTPSHQNPNAPSVVFFADIETATRFYQQLQKANPQKTSIQLYTGLGKEEDIIKRASQPGMITVSTSAIGRNTDIQYEKMQGLKVWHGCVDSIRGMGQKSGRTGRQGSAGEVHFILNEQQLNGLSIEEVQAQIDRIGATERAANEDYYNLLGYLFTQVDAVPNEHFIAGKTSFLKNEWSQFSAETEKRYGEIRQEGLVDKKSFVHEVLQRFNEMMPSLLNRALPLVNETELIKELARQHPQQEPYRAHNQLVDGSDCTPPVTIAYHLLQTPNEEYEPEQTKQAIKTKLHELFSGMTKQNWQVKNQEYVGYLIANPIQKITIVNAHKEFLADFLHPNPSQSGQSKVWKTIKRWLGFEKKLSQIADNTHYLLMFHTFAKLSGSPKEDRLDLVKHSVNTLLSEYLDCWFINEQRRSWALALQNNISMATSVNDVIELLSKSQIEVATLDIETNKQRLIKPLHVSGQSRYQATLSRALNLASALTGTTNVDGLINHLGPLLSEATDNTKLNEVTYDELKYRAKTTKADRANASVLNSSLEKAIEIKHRDGPSGMLGRHGLFKQPSEKDKHSIDQNQTPKCQK